MIEFKVVLLTFPNIRYRYLNNKGWIRNFCLDPDAELGKFRAESGSGINHFGSTTLLNVLCFILCGSGSVFGIRIRIYNPAEYGPI